MTNQRKLNTISLAVSVGLLAQANLVMAADDEIEEVVAVGTRLQGSAAAVIEERRGQAFVADILGAEQLSRTGDSDAASALRRVTGLTLVDGKFIYVRGLGERYSSARLNGASIPSPDLTRNVVPLDIFPSSIIESLSVQKAYSPSMPAAFGGGAIDIRTKSVPSEFTAGIEVGLGYDTSASEGYTYKRNDAGISPSLLEANVLYRGDFSASSIASRNGFVTDDNGTAGAKAIAVNKELLKALPRNFDVKDDSLDPSYNIKAHIGHSMEVYGGDLGFLASVAYDTSWDAGEKMTGVISSEVSANCATSLDTSEQISASCYETKKDAFVTTENERLNAVFNIGYNKDNHKVTWSNILLQDNEDESEIALQQSPAGSSTFTIVGDGQANRNHTFNYEERELIVSQFLGQHTFLDWNNLGFDWQYTESEATTDIPLNVDFEFRDKFENGDYRSSEITGDDNRVMYSFTDMEDHVKSYGGNFTLPVFTSSFEIEFKAGYDFTDRARTYQTSSFAVNSGAAGIVIDNNGEPLNNSDYLTNEFIDANNVTVSFNEPTAPDADDYYAAQKVDAAYGAFDVIYDATWRVSGGVRWEEFKQSSIGSSSLIFTPEDLEIYFSEDRIQDGTIQEDDTYSALSFTYMGGENYQVRLGYGETVVRPDLREVSPVAYFDPLTDIRTIGVVGLQSSPIKNFDLRYEYYGAAGDNFSIAAFYKDIEAPIETILRVGDSDYSASFVNGETAEVVGIEAEWLYDLTFVTDGLFTSGNITLSDSEAVIDPGLAANLTNPTKRMTGHSEYVVNLQLNYDSSDGNHSSSIVYNVFGERILAAGVGGREDAYEQPFHSLDLVYTYYPDFNSKVKFKIKNLLNEDQEVTQSDVIVREREKGMAFSISYTYEFD